MDFKDAIEAVGKGMDAAGVIAIVAGAIYAAVIFIKRVLLNGEEKHFATFRQSLGRSILLGLELLVAGDIIRTVATTPTFTNVGVLAVIVLIRTFLSFSLQLELTGRWPWQEANAGETNHDEVAGASVAR